MKIWRARSPHWRILASSRRKNWLVLDILLAIDGVLLWSDIRKESRMIHLQVVVFDFIISVLHLAAPCFFLGLRDFLLKHKSVHQWNSYRFCNTQHRPDWICLETLICQSLLLLLCRKTDHLFSLPCELFIVLPAVDWVIFSYQIVLWIFYKLTLLSG